MRDGDMTKKLTPKGIEAIKPDPERRVEIPDPALPGLYLVVQPSGAKGWALRYRYAGKPSKLTLGKFPLMGLADARKAASDALAKLELGSNPAVEKKAVKADRLEAQMTERDKVKTLVADFGKRHLSKLKSGDHARQFLDRFTVKAWGERDIHTITKRDVLDLLDGIADSGREVTANRVLAHTRKFLNWCVERDILAVSPAMGVKPVAKETSRDRVLSDDEIRLFWKACDAAGQPWGPFGKLLLLTGQRLNEVAQMRDAEIEGDLWRLSPDRTKNARAHDVPLSRAARDVLRAMERVKSLAGYLHTTNGTSPVQGFHKARATIAEHMAAIAEREAGQPVEIPAWTFHDLRRTCATGLARLAIPVRVTEAVLNHVSGTGAGIVAVYQRHDYAPEKREALEAWGRHVEALVEGRADNVVPLVGAR
jgi:integrase